MKEIHHKEIEIGKQRLQTKENPEIRWLHWLIQPNI